MLKLRLSTECTVLGNTQVKLPVIEVIQCDRVQEALFITLHR